MHEYIHIYIHRPPYIHTYIVLHTYIHRYSECNSLTLKWSAASEPPKPTYDDAAQPTPVSSLLDQTSATRPKHWSGLRTRPSASLPTSFTCCRSILLYHQPVVVYMYTVWPPNLRSCGGAYSRRYVALAQQFRIWLISSSNHQVKSDFATYTCDEIWQASCSD